ncbi:MAG: adenylyl-sulfate kinase, partial [Desulfobulbia bacterium]
DFICPLEEYRELFEADYEIWINTIDEGRFEDTNQLFQKPDRVPNYVVTEHRADLDARRVMWDLLGEGFDGRAPTAQMLGRFQPWHDGHQALFERLLEKEGQVALMVRDMEPDDDDNPYHVLDVCEYLQFQLAEYADKVRIYAAPNITRIGYGRDVGYTIEQEHFDEETESISATDIRQKSKTKDKT